MIFVPPNVYLIFLWESSSEKSALAGRCGDGCELLPIKEAQGFQ